jgi:hypothetical protein
MHANRRSAAANHELDLFINSSPNGVTRVDVSVNLRLTETGSIRKKNFASLNREYGRGLSALACAWLWRDEHRSRQSPTGIGSRVA